MASVGLIPIEWSEDPGLMLPGQKYPTLVKSRLREISITTFGGNLNALMLYDESGKTINLNDISNVNIKINKKETMDSLKIVAGALNLTDKATEAEVVKAALDLKEANTRLTAEVEALRRDKKDLSDKIDNSEKDVLLGAAVSEKKITEKEKAAFIKLSVDDIKTVLADRKPAVDLNNYVQPGNDKSTENLVKMSWKELDRQGKLVELKGKDFEAFKTKFKEEFGKDYK